ncbi:membrane protein insertase YidC [Mycoplasmatota bacterium]|nr:membrane protein insertase YidC [Mycoplasmatota bacterium]
MIKFNKLKMIITLLVIVLVLSGCVSQEVLESPITYEGSFFTKYIVYPVSWMLYKVTEIAGGYYFVGIIITTLIVRTAGWPIYSKSNDMSLKMQAMQPEQQKIQAKYADKKDKESQQRMQMEIQQLYRKYGVNPLGCLLPFLQMPIFLAIYYAVRRIPNNMGTGVLDLNEIGGNTTIFGIDLLKVVKDEIPSNFAYIIIPIVVAATMFALQYVSQRRSKKAQSNVPNYRRNEKAQGMQKQMQVMMYVMVFMMAFVAYSSPAALGFYWMIGNTYSLVQTTINYRLSDKKLLDLKR